MINIYLYKDGVLIDGHTEVELCFAITNLWNISVNILLDLEENINYYTSGLDLENDNKEKGLSFVYGNIENNNYSVVLSNLIYVYKEAYGTNEHGKFDTKIKIHDKQEEGIENNSKYFINGFDRIVR